MRYWFPHPLLSVSLAMMWLLLNQSLSPGQILIGAALGVSLSWVMVNLQPSRTKTRRLAPALLLAWRFAVDVVISNRDVIRVMLRARHQPLRSGFVAVDLKLTNENAIGVLACIISFTPGTAWIEFDIQSRVLLLHVLDLDNGQSEPDIVRDRYESLLLEIFE